MGLSEELSNVRVRVTSPDGRIEGSMRGMGAAAFRFLYDSYETYYERSDPSVLEHQLSRGATLLVVAYKKARWELLEPRGFRKYGQSYPAPSMRHEKYLKLGSTLVAKGQSADGRVRAASRGMFDFKLRLASDIFRAYDQAAFLAAANMAMVNLREDHAAKLAQLRHDLRHGGDV